MPFPNKEWLPSLKLPERTETPASAYQAKKALRVHSQPTPSHRTASLGQQEAQKDGTVSISGIYVPDRLLVFVTLQMTAACPKYKSPFSFGIEETTSHAQPRRRVVDDDRLHRDVK